MTKESVKIFDKWTVIFIAFVLIGAIFAVIYSINRSSMRLECKALSLKSNYPDYKITWNADPVECYGINHEKAVLLKEFKR